MHSQPRMHVRVRQKTDDALDIQNACALRTLGSIRVGDGDGVGVVMQIYMCGDCKMLSAGDLYYIVL